jgi:aminomethyltransferase
VIRTTPFDERTGALNETDIREHWSNHRVAPRYQMSEKFESVAIRYVAGLFDALPLYQYRFAGSDTERFRGWVLARGIRRCERRHPQYTLWCDDGGFVVEAGVLLRHGADDFVLTGIELNNCYASDLVGRLNVSIATATIDGVRT